MTLELTIDEKLLQEAIMLSEQPHPDVAIIAALQEYIQRRKQLKIIELFGRIDYDPDYDYKTQRNYS